MAPHPRDSNDDLLVSADVLGAFGVTATDIERKSTGESTLEGVLTDALGHGIDRTAVLRRLIAQSDRGIACAARYSQTDLASELEAVFEAIGWTLAVTPSPHGAEIVAADPRGRHRETTITYPETPLGTNNLPAVLRDISESLLAGTDARFILLSAGIDRWRGALIEVGELERLRDRYGPRIDAFDRPLLPEYGLEAYVPVEQPEGVSRPTGGSISADADGPWPSWALERGVRHQNEPSVNVGSLIDEAEGRPQAEQDSESNAVEGYEMRGGSPSVTVSQRGTDDAASTDGSESGASESERDVSPERSSERSRNRSTKDRTTGTDDFSTLSGTSPTARISNDAFGTGVSCRSDDDRYRALGAALDAGGNVSARGLLESDDFLPELPAAGPVEIRIEFADRIDPAAIPDANPTADRSGFEWLDASSLEPARASNN
ncbi:hypothetical protein [Natrinema halophilum]|uniref:Uncharacterized protein n=1 Tax=Natrinema halophilum TaxID=1699371 RepID=A0A7D5KDQ1_9EURY|nr:hypothetical protein [Natrinema halophilum]QLG49601.1 hypothetical protein HYG82_12390 [Natrinema halophilum]